VDSVCAALTGGNDGVPAVTALGMARARSGVGLTETLDDLTALFAVLTPDSQVSARLMRAAALGWVEETCEHHTMAGVLDGPTGLTTSGYLRTRLGEVYRAAATDGVPAGDGHALVLVALDLSACRVWSRLVPMVLVAQAMRAVFTSGETVALAGPGAAVALCRRDHRLRGRTGRLRRLVSRSLAHDPAAACAGPAVVSVRRLPPTERRARDLLAGMGGRSQ
jgi:hypothetical protein